ncbi:MAG TPA: protein kinase [Kofleriaceae bacterium]|nr:protein kinase [Kofleriaceae bacterium]
MGDDAGKKLGKYELIARIGHGGMSEVHFAIEGTEDEVRPIVLKIVHDRLATRTELVELLKSEGRLAGHIKHPNVVEIYDVGDSEGRHYIAMEYLAGEPLLAIMRAGVEGQKLDLLSTARIISDTAEALEAAHRLKVDGKHLGLVHHDVSPGNIMVLDDGQVKLVDFGVAKAAKLAADDGDEDIHGKPEYMAPEKLRGGEVDRRSDIWSLGVVAWEALTLTRLFDGEPGKERDTVRQVLEMPIPAPSTVNADIPAELDAIVMKALARDPNKRFGTAKAFAAELEEFLRKNGYGGRINVKIAKYMKATFADRIAARQALMKALVDDELTPAVIEKAFPTAAKTRASANQILIRSQALAVWTPTELADDAGLVAQPILRPSDVEKKKLVPFAIAGGALLIVVVILLIAVGGGGGNAAPAKASSASPPAAKPAKPEPAPEPAVEDVPVAADAAAAVEPEEIELDPFIATPPESKKIEKTPTTSSGFYALGMQQYRAKDPQAALASFNEARRRDPNYANAWYGLGVVHESLGNRGAAKAAFLRYLSLAPRAKNAKQVRARIEKL